MTYAPRRLAALAGRRNPRLSLLSATALAGVAASALPTLALAEDETMDVIASTDGPIVLDTVKVTARRAEEDIRDIPFSVTVIGGDAIEDEGTQNLERTLNATPGLNITSFGETNSSSMKIRGVGSLSRSSTDDNSVALYLDGMPLNPGDLSAHMLDMERIEILKGPQGTLFGRNSQAGAINMVSRKPTDTLEGYVRGEVGTGSQYLTEGAIGGPIVDTLKGRLAFRYSGYDLWVERASTGEPLVSPEDMAVRGTLLWEPTEKTTLTVIGSHETLRDHAPMIVLRPYGDAPVADVPDGRLEDDKWSTRVSAELTHELPFAIATLYSGYTRTDHRTVPPLYEGRLFERLIGFVPDGARTRTMAQDNFNQELRLSSRPQDEVFWVAGANYYRSDRTLRMRDSFDTFRAARTSNADVDRDYGIDSVALFGEATYPILDTLRVTAGLRHTWEHKTYDAVWRAVEDNPSTLRFATDSQSLDEDFTTGRLGLSYDVMPELTVYGMVARGHKSGGWSEFGYDIGRGLSDQPFEAATVDSYEVGVKSAWLDGDLTVNGALFWTETEDDHLMLFDIRTYTTSPHNFDTESKGVELDATWRMGHGFTLGGSLAYIDATITGVPSGIATEVETGNRVPDVPEWGWTLSLSHDMDLPDFLMFDDPMLTTTVSSQYVGERPADAENRFDFYAYNLLDFSLGLSTDTAEIYFRADNLLDERYDLYGYYYPAFSPGGNDATIGGPSRGRTFVVGASYHF